MDNMTWVGPTIAIVFLVLIAAMIIAAIIGRFLTTVPAGVIRIVSWLNGGIRIFKGPGKAIEVPIFTTASSIPSQAINIDLDITDQTADRDNAGIPRPIKVNVQASAIVAVGDTNEMILTAANRFFSKSPQEQLGTLTDLLTSAGRRAVNLLKHDQLFSAMTNTSAAPTEVSNVPIESAIASTADEENFPVRSAPDDEDEDPLAIIIKRQCSRELHDLGLTFKSLNIKVVNSEVAEARRRQSAVEAKANADIVTAEQERRAQEARLNAMQQISDKERDLESRRAQNASTIAQAEALKQDALAVQRAAELRATQIAQATADAERAKVEAQGKAEAERVRLITVAEGEAQRAKLVAAAESEAQRIRLVTTGQGEAERAKLVAQGEAEAERTRLQLVAQGEAERTRLLADAQAEAIQKVNEAIAKGGESYLRIKQLELLPEIAPHIAQALSQARIVNISGDGHAAEGTTSQITGVLQAVLAAQLLKDGLGAPPPDHNGNGTTPPIAPVSQTPQLGPIQRPGGK